MPTQQLPEPLVRLIASVRPRHHRPVVAESLGYAHDGVALEGLLVEPAGGASRAVLIFHAWTGPGPYGEARARMIAGLGYTVLAADMYGADVRPTTVAEMKTESQKLYDDLALMRARAQSAFDVLIARGFTPKDIIVIGYCFGGTVALEHARTGQASAGVVSFHGRLISHEPPDAAEIAAPLLILTGGSDPIAPDEDVVSFMDELRTQPSIDWQLAVYSGAPHAFTVPGPMYHEAADARSWRAFIDFADDVAPVGWAQPTRAQGPVSQRR